MALNVSIEKSLKFMYDSYLGLICTAEGSVRSNNVQVEKYWVSYDWSVKLNLSGCLLAKQVCWHLLLHVFNIFANYKYNSDEKKRKHIVNQNVRM